MLKVKRFILNFLCLLALIIIIQGISVNQCVLRWTEINPVDM